MMASVAFKQVDVFTSVRFKGNPVAVALQAEGLTAAQMQQIANWTNLSETTFVLQPSDSRADYRVRIFTPRAELPFAGHPTIGTAHALLEAGRLDGDRRSIVQECPAGLIKLEVEHEGAERWISFGLPEPKLTSLDDAHVDELEAILGGRIGRDPRPCLVDVGARWIVAQLPDARTVLEVEPDLARMQVQDTRSSATGVVIFGAHDEIAQARIEVRAFAPAQGISEDPVCGSGNGAVAAFIRHTGQTGSFGTRFHASQGAALGRAGFIRLAIDADDIRVGGNAVTCVDGLLSI